MASGTGMSIRQYAYDQARRNQGKEVKILSERALCDIFNVSRPTVRKSLDELVAEGILVIHRGKGTFTNPSIFKEHYLPGSKLSVGIIVGTGKSIVYDRFFWGIISEVGKFFCDDFGDVRLIQTINDDEKAIEEIMLLNIDALVWIHPTKTREPVIEMIQKRGMPVMCVNRIPSSEDVNYVSTDFYAAGQMAAKYLLDKGHEKNLFVANTSVDKYEEFYNGYRDSFSEYNINFDERLAIFNVDEIITDIESLFRFKIKFTACFAMGVDIWAVIEALKMHCGEDFKKKYTLLTTYSSRGEFLDCPFVNIDPHELGKRAALELKAIITEKKQSPVRIKIKPEVVE
jgi:DNA-binding LacI/PurR family transcriptional regulator